MRFSFSFLVLGLALSIPACGGTVPGPDPDPNPNDEALTPLTFLQRNNAAACAQAAKCCTPVELDSVFFLAEPAVSDEASCNTFLNGPLAQTVVASIEASVKSGRAAWDAEAAAECLATLEGASCDDYAAHLSAWGNRRSSDDPGCKALVGKVANGGECAALYECADGFCAGMAPGKLGTCAPKPVAGEPCIQKACDYGFYCEDDGEEGVCRALKADGEACHADMECAGNGCSGALGEEGVCESATTCDGDLGDDQDDLYRSCSIVENPGHGTECRLTSTGWQCDCLVDGDVVSACVPADGASDDAVCTTDSCCTF